MSQSDRWPAGHWSVALRAFPLGSVFEPRCIKILEYFGNWTGSTGLPGLVRKLAVQPGFGRFFLADLAHERIQSSALNQPVEAPVPVFSVEPAVRSGFLN